MMRKRRTSCLETSHLCERARTTNKHLCAREGHLDFPVRMPHRSSSHSNMLTTLWQHDSVVVAKLANDDCDLLAEKYTTWPFGKKYAKTPNYQRPNVSRPTATKSPSLVRLILSYSLSNNSSASRSLSMGSSGSDSVKSAATSSLIAP